MQTTFFLLLAKLLPLILVLKTTTSRFRTGRGPSVLPFALLAESEDDSKEKLIFMQRWNLLKPQVDAGWMCCHESCMLGLQKPLEVFMYELSQG